MTALSTESGEAKPRRLLTRQIQVNLEQFARAMLMERWVPHEEMVEIYRWIAVTASESGLRWRERDDWSHMRFRGMADALGVRRWSKYPTNECGFGLCFTKSSREYLPKIREVIVRAAFGDDPVISMWRSANGLRQCTVPCQILKRVSDRGFDPVGEIYTTQPARFIPQAKEPLRLNVSLNNIHPRARHLFAFVLMPTAEGWRLEINFGQRSRSGGASSWRVYARKWLDDDRPEIPAQRPNESTNEFFARAVEYGQSILEVVAPSAP